MPRRWWPYAASHSEGGSSQFVPRRDHPSTGSRTAGLPHVRSLDAVARGRMAGRPAVGIGWGGHVDAPACHARWMQRRRRETFPDWRWVGFRSLAPEATPMERCCKGGAAVLPTVARARPARSSAGAGREGVQWCFVGGERLHARGASLGRAWVRGPRRLGLLRRGVEGRVDLAVVEHMDGWMNGWDG